MRRQVKFGIRNAECGVKRAAPIIPHSALRIPHSQSAFTLLELLIVILIISILASLALSALGGATEAAREQRTRAIINKLDQLVMEKYESYRTRAVPVRIAPTAGGRLAAGIRLNALRELMRMELPDRRTDIVNYTVSPPQIQTPAMVATTNNSALAITSLQRHYFRAAVRAVTPAGQPLNPSLLLNWTEQHQGSECLYLIISAMRDGDKNAIDFFSTSEIGDVDEDGLKEILDGWGQPIEFLRWAPAYVTQTGPDGQWGVANQDDDNNGTVDDLSEAGAPGSDDHVPLTMQTGLATVAPDPFDPLKADYRWADATAYLKPYALFPLIVSAGRDKQYDIAMQLVDPQGAPFRYVTTIPPNDPYYIPQNNQVPLGALTDNNQDGSLNHADNITNHYQETP
jgi:prepilin-type N-terminal cleavage/methylation domain-containing protein